jgi:hypothetical protein
MKSKCQYCGAERTKSPFNFCNKECKAKFDKIKTKYFNLIKDIFQLSEYACCNADYDRDFYIDIAVGYCSFQHWNSSDTFKKLMQLSEILGTKDIDITGKELPEDGSMGGDSYLDITCTNCIFEED